MNEQMTRRLFAMAGLAAAAVLAGCGKKEAPPPPAAQAPAAAKPGDATHGQVRGHQGNDRVRAMTPAAPAGSATR